jgi:hypothetical protein
VLATSPVNVAPVTVVTFGRGAVNHDGPRYAWRLRQASVDVEELHYDAPVSPRRRRAGRDGSCDRLVRDPALSLLGTRFDQQPQQRQPPRRTRCRL